MIHGKFMARIYLHDAMARCVVLAAFMVVLPSVAQQNNQEGTTGNNVAENTNAQQSGAYRQDTTRG
jgi:hypothetical protein